MPPSLASSVMAREGYDLHKTLDAALANGFISVQLFIDETKQGKLYINKLIEKLKASNIKSIVIHLRNLTFLSEGDIQIAERIENELPEIAVTHLVHYGVGMKEEDIPIVNGYEVAIENSKNEFDYKYILEIWNFTRKAKVPMVFDYLRLMYPKNEVEQNEIIDFIKWFIGDCLVAGWDIIHAADKLDWNKRAMECPTFIGDLNGVGYPLVEVLQDFSYRYGVVVFEHEDLDLAVKSLAAFV